MMYTGEIINYYTDNCNISVILSDERIFELTLEEQSIAYCDDWHYCLVNRLETLLYIVNELRQQNIDIEIEDIDAILYEDYIEL